MKLSTAFSALLASVSLSGVQAHTIFQQLYVNGVSPGHGVGIRQATTNNPVTDVTSSAVIVRDPSSSLQSKLTLRQKSATALWYVSLYDDCRRNP